MDSIGTTLIVSNDYDPNCMVTFVEGYIRRLKKEKEVLKENDLRVARCLTYNADCVDKGVITEVIDLGLRYVFGEVCVYKL